MPGQPMTRRGASADETVEALVRRSRHLAIWALIVPLPVGILTWFWALAGDPKVRHKHLFEYGGPLWRAMVVAVIVASVLGAGLAVGAELLMHDALLRMSPEQADAAKPTRRLLIAELVVATVVLAPIVLLALDASDRLAGERSVAFLVAVGIPGSVSLIAWATVRVTKHRRTPPRRLADRHPA